MTFARRVFLAAGVWGLLVLTPMWFLEDRVGRDYPPPVTHPEFYYGFTGVTLAWQILYLIVSRDPVRLRPVMLPGAFGKLSFVATVVVLWLLSRAPTLLVVMAAPDLLLSGLFVAAFVKTRT